MLEIRSLGTVPWKTFSPRLFVSRYAAVAPLPIAVATSWAVALSAASNIRNKVLSFSLPFLIIMISVTS